MKFPVKKVSAIKIIGIVAEYDPFTNGHAEHIRRTKSAFQDECAVVCAMSGSFTQRGEPASLDKFVRARAAVESGIDLVLELPTDFAVASAERFAFGAVSLLDALGAVDILSFGSESGNIRELIDTAEILANPGIDQEIRAGLASGASYATARALAAEKIAGRKLPALSKPNDILAVEYIKALKKTGSRIQPFAVQRTGAHNSPDEKFPSASVLRSVIAKGCSVAGMTTAACTEIIDSEVSSGRGPVTLHDFETAILSHLRSMELSELEALPDSGDGLSERLFKASKKACTLDELLELTKTKRLAMSRVRRAVLNAYLGITASARATVPQYLRILAATPEGCSVLKKADHRLPVITKAVTGKSLEGEALTEFMLDVRASDLRSLGRPLKETRIAGEDWLISPYIVK